MSSLNKNICEMVCIKCQSTYEVSDFYKGCPTCFASDEPASVSFNYRSFRIHSEKTRMFKYTDLLPYTSFPTLGEGDTPLYQLKRLGHELGLQELWVKNEGQNPTGSHKDRMSPLIIARAQAMGTKTVAVASSGNAGTSLAAYAAIGGLKCVVLTTRDINPIWKQALESTDADIIYKEEAMDRWKHMKQMVEQDAWYPATNFENPPVGSNPFGVQGYKTIAYEIIEQSKELPEVIIVPCSRGDMLWGIWAGFKEALQADVITQLPRLIAVEPFPRLKKVFQGHAYTDSFRGESTKTPSIGGSTVTYQAYQAIEKSNGDVYAISHEQARHEQLHLGKHGIYAERSSALVLGALKKMIDEYAIQGHEKVLLIMSSNGYKELV